MHDHTITGCTPAAARLVWASMTLSHDVSGQGPAVVLLHSTVCDRRMWDPQVPVLAGAGFAAVRCDLRGFGETPPPERPYDDAQDVADLLDELGFARAALVGSSGGGYVALEFAARWPDRVTALVLLCTAMAGHERSAALRRIGEREEEAGDVDGATELNVATWVGPAADEATRDKVRRMQRDVFGIQLTWDEVEQVEVDHDPGAITAPTLLVSGAHDVADFHQIAVELARRIPGARHVELDWAGHLPSLERPEAVNPLLLEFLREKV
jgi:3-oxoadipate enol-lactonase